MSARRRGASLGLPQRTSALEAARHAGAGRLDPDLVARVDAVLGAGRARAALSSEHTVVALAGATGAGKSSLFNALAGGAVQDVGVRRPTTSDAAAWVRGEGAGPLLDWLGVRDRHEAPGAEAQPAGASDAGAAAPGGAPALPDAPDGLVLLDLPDHDSVVVEHRERAERLVERADLLVWVLDPQKYADAALHERYLRPLAGHADVMVLVLNQIDRLAPADAAACLDDVRRLAWEDGLGDVRVLGVSARTGAGLGELRDLLADAVRRREAATARRTADVRAVAGDVLAACGEPLPDRASRVAQAELHRALESAAGVDLVVDAVRASVLRRARSATGWPVTRWLGRLRPDPLRRLRLEDPGRDPDLVRSSLPSQAPAVAAQARVAVRGYVRAVSRGAPDAWVRAVDRRGADAVAALPDALDRAVVATRLSAARPPRWWRAVDVVQWVLLGVAALGLLWLGALALLGYLQLPRPGTPEWHGVPLPTGLLVAGVVAGLLLALVARGLAGLGARRRARGARARLRAAVATVADERVRLPVAEELAALATCRTSAAIAAS
ncbi:GTPase [Luteimicrobium sp. NPDC057192]|uniref:GTPase n=1 Tax=Luteimicrobium sp. NPDC057192 TaxID=3346042 RepID=UPI00362E9934